jgi:hypothetical protein
MASSIWLASRHDENLFKCNAPKSRSGSPPHATDLRFAQPKTWPNRPDHVRQPCHDIPHSPIQTSRLHPHLHFVVGGHRIVSFPAFRRLGSAVPVLDHGLHGQARLRRDAASAKASRLGKLKQLPRSRPLADTWLVRCGRLPQDPSNATKRLQDPLRCSPCPRSACLVSIRLRGRGGG